MQGRDRSVTFTMRGTWEGGGGVGMLNDRMQGRDRSVTFTRRGEGRWGRGGLNDRMPGGGLGG